MRVTTPPRLMFRTHIAGPVLVAAVTIMLTAAHISEASGISTIEGVIVFSRLENGELFPDMKIDVVGGRTVTLPRDLVGSYAVVLFYRGSWCPYCNAQLAAFSRAREVCAACDIGIVALSVDDEATTKALIEKLHLSFTVGFGANAENIRAATGAYVAEGSAYLQSTGFVLDRCGRILTAVYSSGAIGRLVPDDVVGFVKYVEAHRHETSTPSVQCDEHQPA